MFYVPPLHPLILLRHESRCGHRPFDIRRVSDVTNGGHAEAPGSGVVGFDNFRQAARVV